MKRIFIIMGYILLLCSFAFASPQTESGLNWLYSAQNPDGSWGTDYILPSTTEAIETLQTLTQTNTSNYLSSINWLGTQGLYTTEYVSERINALSVSGTDTVLLLSYIDSYKNAWGGNQEYQVNNYDTVLALQALTKINYQDTDTINSALSYLLSTQNPDGSWGFYMGDDGNVFMTAIVSSAIKNYGQYISVASALNKSVSYLILHQNPDGGWGLDGSTTYETALAYMALQGQTTDATVLSGAVNYLTSTQLSDGSWAEDPYSTALALRALYISENQPVTPPPAPTTGSLGGNIIDQSSKQPIAGATITLSGASTVAAVTDNTGRFTFAELPAGSYQAGISAQGYGAGSATFGITAGAVLDLGIIGLSSIPTTGVIKGRISDSDSGLALSGATVEVSGAYSATAITATDGTYYIGSIPPGPATITATMTGYDTTSGSGNITAGGTLNFSPKLVKSAGVPPQTTGRITGTVKDATSGAVLPGVSVSIGSGATALTDGAGEFDVSGIAPDAYSVTLGKTGYVAQTFEVVVTAGVNVEMQNIFMMPTATSTTVMGVVRQKMIGNALKGVTVVVYGTDLYAVTDDSGRFTIAGITDLSFTLKGIVTGFDTSVKEIQTSAYGTVTVNFELSPGVSSGLGIKSFGMEKSSYTLRDEMVAPITIENVALLAQTGVLNASILDASGNVAALGYTDIGMLTIGPSGTIDTFVRWDTGTNSPGDYILRVQVRDVMHDTFSTKLFAEKTVPFRITAASDFAGSVNLSPTATTLDSSTPVSMQGIIRNSGNIPLTGTMRMTAVINGTTAFSKDVSLNEVKKNEILYLDFGLFAPDTEGNYQISIMSLDASVASVINGSLFVGKHAEALFVVSPKVAKAGDIRVLGKLHVSGAGVAATGNSTELSKLAPIIKQSLTDVVRYLQKSEVSWDKQNNCYGCHEQAQTLSAFEVAKNKVAVDNSVMAYLYDKIFNKYNAEFASGRFESNALFLWQLSFAKNEEWMRPYIVNAAEMVLQAQTPSGLWYNTAHPSHYFYMDRIIWWDNEHGSTSLALTALSHAYRITKDDRYRQAVKKGYAALLTLQVGYAYDHAKKSLGLADAMDLIDDPALVASAKGAIAQMKTAMTNEQNASGAWDWNEITIRTPFIVYVAMRTGINGDDPVIIKAVKKMINDQNSNGTWGNHNMLPSMVAIAIPVVLDKMGGLEVEVNLKFSSDYTVNSIGPYPVSKNGDSYTMTVPGVYDFGRDIDIDMTLKNVSQSEERPVAVSGTMTFKNTITGELIQVPIDIPKVLGTYAVTGESLVTDKTAYVANADINVSATVRNMGNAPMDAIAKVTIEDPNGNAVSGSYSETAHGLKPAGLWDWGYRIGYTVTDNRMIGDSVATVNIDFANALSSIGIAGRSLDTNSVRVLEFDGAGNYKSEKLTKVEFQGGSNAKVRWLVDGTTQPGNTRYFYVYFDTTDNGPKDASLKNTLSLPASLIAYSDINGYIYTIANNGDGTFGPLTQASKTLLTRYVFGVVIADFNHDGYSDLASLATVFENTQMNTFKGAYEIVPLRYLYSLTDYVMDMAVGDFNNDGHLDFVESGVKYDSWMFLGHGDMTFDRVLLLTPDAYGFQSSNGPRGKAAADFNMDGNLDMVMGDYDGQIFLYNGNGAGGFKNISRIADIGSDPYGVAAGDFDGDGNPDVIANDALTVKAFLIKGNGDGTFFAPVEVPSLNVGIYVGFEAADINGDGVLDILSTDPFQKTIKYYLGLGDGSFGTPIVIATTPSGGLGISASPTYPVVKPVLTVMEAVPSYVLDLSWNSGNTYAGQYNAHLTLVQPDGSEADYYVAFDITPDIRAMASISADKMSYGANEDVTIETSVESASVNYMMEGLVERVTVKSPSGAIISVIENQIPMLIQGQRVSFKNFWNTASTPKGFYNLSVDVVYQNAIIATTAKTFEIVGSTSNGSGIVGSISASPKSIAPGTIESLSFTVGNIGNEGLSGLSIDVVVVNPETKAVLTTITQVSDIQAGTSLSGAFSLNTAGLQLGTYLVVLQVHAVSLMEPKTLGGTSFSIIDITPPVVSIIHPANATILSGGVNIQAVATDDTSGVDKVEYSLDGGMWTSMTTSSSAYYTAQWLPVLSEEGLHIISVRAFDRAGNVTPTPQTAAITLELLSGIVTAIPTQINLGKDEGIAYLVTNDGYADEKGIGVKVIVKNDAGAIVDELKVVIDIAARTTASGAFSIATIDFRLGNYTVELWTTYGASAKTKILATSVFTVTAPPETKRKLDMEMSVVDVQRTLVWLNYGWVSGNNLPDRNAIVNALAATGAVYRFVYDKKDFQRELRNPFYTDIVILGSFNPIEDHYSRELREEVAGGKGLVVSLMSDPILNGDVFGIKPAGNITGKTAELALTSSAVSDAETITGADNILKLSLTKNSVVAGYALEQTKKGVNIYPAVILGEYGEGKTIYFSFDIGLLAGNYNGFDSLLGRSLEYVHNTAVSNTFSPDSIVPVRLTVHNPESAVDLRMTVTYPDLALFDPLTGEWSTGEPLVNDIHLDMGESKEIYYYAFVSDATGEYKLTTEAGYLENGSYNIIKTVAETIPVLKVSSELIEDVSTDLESINLAGNDWAKIQNIQRYVAQVSGRRNDPMPENIEADINDLIKALDSLIDVNADMSSIRRKLDIVLITRQSSAYK